MRLTDQTADIYANRWTRLSVSAWSCFKRRSSCEEETCCRRNLLCVSVRERNGTGTGRKNGDRQCAEGPGRFEIHYLFGIGEGRRLPAVRSQFHGHDVQGHS